MPEEFPQPRPETEFRQPEPEAEDSAPPGTDHANPPEDAEFSPPGSGRAETAPPGKRRRLRQLLYGAAALVLLGLFSVNGNDALPASTVTAQPSAAPIYSSGPEPSLTTTPPASGPSAQPGAEPVPSAQTSPEPSVQPSAEPSPEPAGNDPQIEIDFFYFSSEHHGFLRLDNTGAVRSVSVSVRDKTLDLPVYSHELSAGEIASGGFELPELDAGDLYMDNMAAYDASGGWPAFEMTVDVLYENDDGAEETLSLTREADFELGLGLNYMRADFNWSESIPSDSFYVQPWEELDNLRFVINDPDAVKDPLTISVDLSWNGRHAAPEEYETVLEKSEYTITDPNTGESTPHVGYTSELVLRRPDWMPEEGVLHVHIVQYLASTGELWIRDYDFEYPQRYSW